MNGNSPFFSICIPVYNVEKFLIQCLNSVKNQTFSDYEVIIVDDGSTDKSSILCDQFCRQNFKFKVIHQKNKGLLLTRRVGIQKATGKYLMFLDSDDMLRKDALEIIKKNIDYCNADMVIFNSSIDSHFSIPFHRIPLEDNKKIIEKKVIYELISGSPLLNNMCHKAVKRTIINVENDYSAFKNVSMGEDILQTLPLVDKAERVVFCSELLYFYRQNANSMSHRFDLEGDKAFLVVQRERLKYAKKWDMEIKNTELSFSQLALEKSINDFAELIMSLLLSNNKWKDKVSYMRRIVISEQFLDSYTHAQKIGLKKRILLKVAKYKLFFLLHIVDSICRIKKNK